MSKTSQKRFPGLPEVQAAAEVIPGYEATNWYAVLAPAGVSKATFDRIVSGVRGALKDPAVIKAIDSAGAEPLGGPPDQFAKYLRAEIAKWTKVIREAKVAQQK